MPRRPERLSVRTRSIVPSKTRPQGSPRPGLRTVRLYSGAADAKFEIMRFGPGGAFVFTALMDTYAVWPVPAV